MFRSRARSISSPLKILQEYRLDVNYCLAIVIFT